MKLLFAIVLLFSTFSNAKEVQAQKETPLLAYEQMMKLSPSDRELYLEGLRDFMDEVQYKDPKLAQLLFERILSSMVPEANAVDKDCENQIKYKIGGEVSKECYPELLNVIRDGKMGKCDFDVNTRELKCDDVKHPFVLESSICRQKMTSNQLARKCIVMSEAMAGAALEGNKKVADAGQPKPPPVEAPALIQKPPAKKDDPSRLRCFFGGFAIGASKDGKDNTCDPVSKMCDGKRPERMGFDIGKAGFEKLCKSFSDEKKASCPSSEEAGAVATGAKSKETVVCNPLLYGVSDKGAVLCVARSGNASKNCRDKANKMSDAAKKAFEKLLSENKEAFNRMISNISLNCGKFTTKDKDGKIIWGTDDDSKKYESDAGWSTRGKDKNSGRRDIQKTCQQLLDRVAEVRASNPGLFHNSNVNPEGGVK